LLLIKKGRRPRFERHTPLPCPGLAKGARSGEEIVTNIRQSWRGRECQAAGVVEFRGDELPRSEILRAIVEAHGKVSPGCDFPGLDTRELADLAR